MITQEKLKRALRQCSIDDIPNLDNKEVYIINEKEVLKYMLENKYITE